MVSAAKRPTAPAPTPAPTPAPPVASLLDLSIMSGPSPTPPSASSIPSLLDLAPPLSYATPPSLSPLNSLSSTPLSSSSSSALQGSAFAFQLTPGRNFDLNNLQAIPPIQKLQGKILSPSVNQNLHEDDNLRLSYVKALEPNATSFALFASNKTTSNDLTELQYTITCAKDLKIVLPNDGTHVSTETNVPTTLKTRVKTLPHLATSVLVADLQIGNWEFNLTSTVAASYIIDDRVQYARFQLPIVITDFLRSHVVPIQTYGQLWKTFTKTATHAVPTKTINSAEIYRKLVTEANFGVIDVKGLEIVSCSRALPYGGASTTPGSPDYILLYGKINQGQVLLTVKGQNQTVVDAIGTALKQLFSNK